MAEKNKEPKELKFKCPHCGGTSLDSVENVTVAYPIKRITQDGVDSYGERERNYGGEVQYYSCHDCGERLENEDGDTISSDDELVEWLETEVEQE